MVDFKTEGFGLGLKLQNLIIFENILVVLLLLVGFNTLPQWFQFLEKIKFNYVVAIMNMSKMDKQKVSDNKNNEVENKNK